MTDSSESAEDSPSRKWELIRALQGVSPDVAATTDAVAELIELPDSCAGLFRIADNLSMMREHLQILPIDAAVVDEMCDWAEAVCSLSHEAGPRKIPDLVRDEEGSSGRGPVHGLMESHPVWSALWFRARDASRADQTRYRQLQALLLAAHTQLAGQKVAQGFAGKLYQAGLFVRELRMADQRRRLWRLTAEPDKPKSVRDQCAEERSGQYGRIHNRMFWRRLGTVIEVLEQAFELPALRPPGGGGGGGGRWRGYIRPRWIYWERPADHTRYWMSARSGERAWGNAEFTTYETLPDGSERDELINTGLDPGEYAISASVGVEWQELDDRAAQQVEPEALCDSPAQTDDASELAPHRRADDQPGELPPLGTQYARARGRARRVTMDIQHVPWDPHRVRRPHIEHIVRVLSDQFEAGGGRDQNATVHDATLIAALALVTGASLDELAQLELHDSSATLPMGCPIAYSPRNRVWVRCQQHAAVRKNPVAGNDASVPRIVLPDAWGVGRHLDEAVVARLRHWDPKTLQKTWNQLIRPALITKGVPSKWATFKGMSDILPSWLKGVFGEGNHLPIALIFDRSEAHTSTHRFYSAIERDQIAQDYGDAMERLWQAVAPKDPKQSTLFVRDGSRKRGIREAIGDGVPPSLEDVRALVQAARAEALSAHDSPYEQHNSLVVYVGIALAVVTGFRPVRTPIPDLTAIHRETGTICLQEKDRADKAHARLALLPERVIEQVDTYIDHARAMASRLPKRQSVEMRVRATKHRDLRLASGESAYYCLDLRKTLYIWDRIANQGADWRALEFTGARLQLRCHELAGEQCWPLPSAGRHLLRSYLFARGCTPTLINAAMGHWSYGEEPWTAESAMNPILYREEIAEHLDALLDEIDFEPIRPR